MLKAFQIPQWLRMGFHSLMLYGALENDYYRTVKTVFYINSVENPLVDAWLDFILMTELEFVVVAEIEISDVVKLPERFREFLVIKNFENQWKNQAEDFLGGIPDVIIYWWGLQSLQRHDLHNTWRRSRLVIIVDTFPNASRSATEIREIVFANKLLYRVDTLIVSSHEMMNSLRNTFKKATKDVNFCLVPTPFCLRNHFGRTNTGLPLKSNRPSIIFLGRSDFLFSGYQKMLKDDLGDIFSKFISEGADITVRDTGNSNTNSLLIERGLSLYESFDRDSMTNGNFSKYISLFDAQIPIYNVHNKTIKKRVANGLSTRFAQGICSDSPLIMQEASSSGVNFIRQSGTGTVLNKNISQVLEFIDTNQSKMRNNWRDNHFDWAAETFQESFVAGIASRKII